MRGLRKPGVLAAVMLFAALSIRTAETTDYCDAGDHRVTTDCTMKMPLPNGAVVSGDRWSCPEGTEYEELTYSCAPTAAAAPGATSGPDGKLRCKDGFRAAFGLCNPIFVPDNAYAVGDTFECNDTFKRCDSSCIRANERCVALDDAEDRAREDELVASLQACCQHRDGVKRPLECIDGLVVCRDGKPSASCPCPGAR